MKKAFFFIVSAVWGYAFSYVLWLFVRLLTPRLLDEESWGCVIGILIIFFFIYFAAYILLWGPVILCSQILRPKANRIVAILFFIFHGVYSCILPWRYTLSGKEIVIAVCVNVVTLIIFAIPITVLYKEDYGDDKDDVVEDEKPQPRRELLTAEMERDVELVDEDGYMIVPDFEVGDEVMLNIGKGGEMCLQFIEAKHSDGTLELYDVECGMTFKLPSEQLAIALLVGMGIADKVRIRDEALSDDEAHGEKDDDKQQ